ncbi:MAG: hypothetical protein A3K68_00780 [Euryarchaeota archaeon RBG_16_68_13]|nr:MAG: hypothetical protein A3K68_00780 [Euryarchaeota archaeon RBG_16_68_13]
MDLGVSGTSPPSSVPWLVTGTFPVVGDTFLDEQNMSRNYGGTTQLVVGASGPAYRALAKFDLTSIPQQASVLDATLRAYVTQGPVNQRIDAHEVRTPWIEGSGGQFAYRQTITVTETAGVRRLREPVDIRLDLPVSLSTLVQADFRVFDETGQEVPSQVYGAEYWGPDVTRVHIVFGATVNASASRAYDLYYGTAVPVVPSFRTRTPWVELWRYPAGANYASPMAADLDGDGQMEVVFGSEDTWIYALHANGSLYWKRKAPDVVQYVTTVVDVDRDGDLDVLYGTSGNTDYKLYAVGGDNSSEVWNTGASPGRAILAPVALADVDGDGSLEIYGGSQDRFLYGFNGSDGSLAWTPISLGSVNGYGAAVGNVTGGPEMEIVFTTFGGDFYIVDANGSVVKTVTPTGQTMLVTASLADFDGDGGLDLVGGDLANNGNQFAVNVETGIPIWNHGSLSTQYGGQILVDFEDDGAVETIFAATRRNSIRALPANGNPSLWTFLEDGPTYAIPAAADVNLDGVEDILVGSFGTQMYVVNSTGNLIRNFSDPSGFTATPIVADLDGDGTMEIVFSSRTTTYAYSTASLGHDFRMTGYNYRFTGRFLDGNSPDGAPLLQTVLGALESLSTTGATWESSDGTVPWITAGGDYNLTATGTAISPGTGGWMTWNVTTLVQRWTEGSQPNLGLLLKAGNEAISGMSIFGGREGVPAFAASLEVLYNENLEPRIRSRVPNQEAPEDSAPWSVDLASYADDPDTPIQGLRWDVVGANPAIFDVTGANRTGNHILEFHLKDDANGNNLVTLFLFDEGDRYATQPLWVNIIPVNDPPYWGAFKPSTLYVRRGFDYVFGFGPHVFDVDNSDGELALRSNRPATTIAIDELNATFRYPADYAEPWDFVIFTVDDGELTASHAITIAISDDAPPQLIRSLPNITLNEGETLADAFDLDDHFVDPDLDALFYSYGQENVEVTIDRPENTVDFRASGNWYGVEYVTFRAQDPTGALAEDTIRVTVLPVNDPPAIEAIPPFVIHYNETYRFDIGPHILDPDTDLSDIRVRTTLSANITVQGTVLFMLFPWRYNNFTVAPYVLPLTIYANDTVDETYLITSVTVSDNHPPELTMELPDRVMFEDVPLLNAFDLDDHFRDVDPDSTIFYTSGQIFLEVIIGGDHKVNFTSGIPDWYGVEKVTFRARDEQGGYQEDTIKVTVRPVNDVPRVSEIEEIVSSTPKFFFNLVDYVTDVENDTVNAWVTHPHVRAQGLILIFEYPDSVNEDVVNVTLYDWELSTSVLLRIRIVGPDPFMMILPWLLALAGAGVVIVASRTLRSAVEHVFLIYGGGVPIVHLSRTLTADKDPDLVASMFTAIQSFMNESFHSIGVGELKSIELADHRVALARGEFVTLIVLYRGHRTSRIDRRAEDIVEQIETRFRDTLKDWNGDIDRIAGVKLMLERMYGAKETGQVFRGRESTDLGHKAGPTNDK